MTAHDLKQGRVSAGMSQTQAARSLSVSQSYLAMLERGQRRLTAKLAFQAMKVYGLPATVLPHSLPRSRDRGDAQALANDLGMLGYPGFAYLRSASRKPKNPGDVLLSALSQPDLEARVVEALPWLLLTYPAIDRMWLVREVRVRNLQNRLGFVATLARRLAERRADAPATMALKALEADLEDSRLAREDTLGQVSLAQAERRWLRDHRPEDAEHWNILTDWTVDRLRYASAV